MCDANIVDAELDVSAFVVLQELRVQHSLADLVDGRDAVHGDVCDLGRRAPRTPHSSDLLIVFVVP